MSTDMNNLAYANLSKRLDCLARTNRLLAAIVVALLAMWIAGGSNGGAPHAQNVVRARRIEMVDADGQTRAELAVDADGSAGLFVRDDKGRIRASLTHDSDQSAMLLRDDEGVVRVGAAHFAHGGSGFALHGPKSKGGAVLYHKGEGSIRFFDRDGRVTNQVSARK